MEIARLTLNLPTLVLKQDPFGTSNHMFGEAIYNIAREHF